MGPRPRSTTRQGPYPPHRAASEVQERTQGHWKGSPVLGSATPTATGMTHTCLGSFSKMCQACPQGPKTTTEQWPTPSPRQDTPSQEEEHSPYPSGPSAPRTSRRILWSSLQRDDTAAHDAGNLGNPLQIVSAEDFGTRIHVVKHASVDADRGVET